MAMKTPVHPGEILREDVLADLGLSVVEAAARLGISPVTLSRVLHGHARLSPNLAVRLEEAGVSTASAWLAMQTAYDLATEHAAGVPAVRRLDDVARDRGLVRRGDAVNTSVCADGARKRRSRHWYR